MSPPASAFAEIVAPKPLEVWQRYQPSSGSVEEGSLVEQYLPLVKTVVGRLAMTLPPHVDKQDLQSAGVIGLLNALRHFDPTAQTNFETYARIRIRGAVLDELRRMDWVPRSVHAKARKIETAMQQLQQRDTQPPQEAEVAKMLGISVEEYRQWLDEIKPATFVSLDAANEAGDDDSMLHGECVADDSQESPYDDVARRNLIGVITERLAQLPEMQRKVIALYYLEDLRLREIAEVFGVTESRICQIHSEAITAIRSYVSKFESKPK